jgi:transketolase
MSSTVGSLAVTPGFHGVAADPMAAADPTPAPSLARLAAALRQRVRGARPATATDPLILAATVLWSRFHKFDAADPGWPDRDRVLLCDGANPGLDHALLDLCGAGPRGGPEARPAAELAAGPLGHGLGHAVGLALAERALAARFGRSLVDHRTWVLAASRDLLGGPGHEAASLAGHARLGRLAVLWGPPGDEAASAAADTARRFAVYGWAVRRIDGRSPDRIAAACAAALRSARPTLIICLGERAHAAAPRPGNGASADPDGGEAGGGEADACEADGCEAGGLDARVLEAGGLEAIDAAAIGVAWAAAGARGSTARRAWLKRLSRHTLRAEFERVMTGRLPDGLHDALTALRAGLAASRPAMATRAASEQVLEAIRPRLPELVGGYPDPPAPVAPPPARPFDATRRAAGPAAALSWPLLDHGVAAAMTGMALHGGLIPLGGTLVVLTDHIRPALRLAALMRQRVIHVLTRDGGDRAEGADDDGPGQQPIEQLAGLRSVPNLFVLRPADAIETAECWELALARGDGPSLLALSRQPVPSLRPPGPAGDNRAARGGYVLAEAEGAREVTLIATGAEVATAMAARETLRGEGRRVAVVSLPCWELFERLSEPEREAVLGAAPRIGIEAAGPFGWARWLGSGGVFVGFQRLASDPRALAWSTQARPTAADVVAAARRALGGG